MQYARVLGVPAELLWFEVEDEEPPRPPATRTLRLSTGTVPATVSTPGPMLADSLLTTLDEYVLTDNLAGPHSLLPIVTQQVQFIERLEETSRGRTRTRLRAARARFAEFLGWLHQDAGHLDAAVEWTAHAVGLARELRDDRLLAYIRMRQGNLAFDADNPQATIDLAEAALRTSADLTARQRATTLRQLAHGHARLGNGDACARALGQAWENAARPGNADDDLAGYCTPEYLAMEAAQCQIALGRPDQAINVLEPRLPRWHPENRRDLGRGLTLFAVALARTRQPDKALDVAGHALAVTAETRSTRTELQLYRVVRELHVNDAHDHAAELRIALHRMLR